VLASDMASSVLHIRQATDADASALLSIYAPFIESMPVTFEITVPPADEFAARIAKSLSKWQWLVAECEGRIAGYAYGSTHRERAAYRYSVEVSAYLHGDFHRRGIGSALYRRLFDDLIAKGYCTAFAGITLPNDASVGMHARWDLTRLASSGTSGGSSIAGTMSRGCRESCGRDHSSSELAHSSRQTLRAT